MNNDTQTFGVDENNQIIPPSIQGTMNETGEISDLTSGVQDTVAHITNSDITTEITPEINYTQLTFEHAELLLQNKTSREIAEWIGNKLHIPSWKNGEFYGERKVLSSPQTPAEIQRLQKFVEALGVTWSRANGGSDNYSQYFLLDGYIQNALFGQENMTQVNASLDIFHADWNNMGNDLTAKAKYLLEKFGLDIQGNWPQLTGVRDANGNFDFSFVLFASGSLDGDKVRKMGLRSHASDIDLRHASDARLCFLT